MVKHDVSNFWSGESRVIEDHAHVVEREIQHVKKNICGIIFLVIFELPRQDCS